MMPHRPIDGLAISPEKGAETIIYLASSPKIAATTLGAAFGR
jgi:hypothetical protein